MATYTDTFTEQIGTTNEQIDIQIDYCEDFNGDGSDDIKVTLSVANASNSGTEDMIGVAFDIQNDAVGGLAIEDIVTSTNSGTLSTFSPTAVIGANQISDGGPIDPGFNTSGGNTQEPYDVGIQFSASGSGEGIVQTASFVITSAGVDLDAEALLENTDWWIRLQSTNGGGGSAKTGGFILDLPPCDDEPPEPEGEPGSGNTPGFWKQEQHFEFWEGYGPADPFTGTFGVTGDIPFDDTLLDALDAGGGGLNALGRAGTAALLNAASSSINYAYSNDGGTTANAELEIGVVEADTTVFEVLPILNQIDLNSDGSISESEVIGAVQSAFSGTLGVEDVAIAFDAMNNMPSVEVEDFV